MEDFTTVDLIITKERGGFFAEKEVKWVNPREFHRKAISDMEDLGFEIPRGTNERLEMYPEKIGTRTGFFESRIEGFKKQEGSGIIDHFPFRRLGVGLFILGIITLFLSFMSASLGASFFLNPFFISSILLLIGGVIAAIYKKKSVFTVRLHPVIRILSVGEVTERTIKRKGADVADLVARLTVIFGGESFIYSELDDIPNSALRSAIEAKFTNLFTPMSYIQKDFTLGNILDKNSLKKFEKENDQLKQTFDVLTKRISKYGRGIEEK